MHGDTLVPDDSHRSNAHDHVRDGHGHANMASNRQVTTPLTPQKSKQLCVSFDHLRAGPCLTL